MSDYEGLREREPGWFVPAWGLINDGCTLFDSLESADVGPYAYAAVCLLWEMHWDLRRTRDELAKMLLEARGDPAGEAEVRALVAEVYGRVRLYGDAESWTAGGTGS
jgi:hypothetical protein